MDELHDNVVNRVAFAARKITSFLPDIMYQWYSDAAVLQTSYCVPHVS